MSVLTLVQIACDGPRVGLACTTEPVTSSTLNINEVRAVLRRNRQWTRREHGETTVDLCPACSPHAVLAPRVFEGRPRGRPPKARPAAR